MKSEGRVCHLNRQLTTTVFALAAGALRLVNAVSVARVGADAQPVAATDSKMAMRTATRFMVSSLATTLVTYLDEVRRSWLRNRPRRPASPRSRGRSRR